MAKSKSFHHGDLKRALMRSALEILDKEDVAGVTIRAVAKRAGVSHAAPANHFPDRRALLTALAAEQFAVVFDKIRAGIDAKTSDTRADLDPLDRIAVLFDSFLTYGLEYPYRYQLLWRYDLVDHEVEIVKQPADRVYDFLVGEIEKVVDRNTVDPDTVSVTIWSMMHGYLDLRMTGMFEDRRDRISGAPRAQAMLMIVRDYLHDLGSRV